MDFKSLFQCVRNPQTQMLKNNAREKKNFYEGRDKTLVLYKFYHYLRDTASKGSLYPSSNNANFMGLLFTLLIFALHDVNSSKINLKVPLPLMTGDD